MIQSNVIPVPGDVVVLKGKDFFKSWSEERVRPGDRGIFYQHELQDERIGYVSWNDKNIFRERGTGKPGVSRSGNSISHPVLLSKLRLAGKTTTEFWCWNGKRSHPTKGKTEEHRDRYELEVNLWEWDGIQQVEPRCCLLESIDVSPFEEKTKQGWPFVDKAKLEDYLTSCGFEVTRPYYLGGETIIKIGDFGCWQVREGWVTAYIDPDTQHYYGYRLYKYKGNYSKPFSAALNRYFEDNCLYNAVV